MVTADVTAGVAVDASAYAVPPPPARTIAAAAAVIGTGSRLTNLSMALLV
jgi:hypothetical protein